MAAGRSCGDISGLPADCIANVLSLTTPKDACRLSLVGTTFRSAAESDGVWERFLPHDYGDIISRSIVGGSRSLLHEFQSKKYLYLRLSDHPIVIDSGSKSFNLDKCSGKKCYMLAARDLSIIWGDTPQHWQWKSHPKSRFSEVAKLLNVCWLEIRGCINSQILSCGTNYAAYLVFTTDSGMHGFHHLPAEACVGIKGLEMGKHTIYLESDTELLKQREDGWMEVELGQYFVTGGDNDIVEMSLLEVEKLNWKSGLIIQGIEIRPKECI